MGYTVYFTTHENPLCIAGDENWGQQTVVGVGLGRFATCCGVDVDGRGDAAGLVPRATTELNQMKSSFLLQACSFNVLTRTIRQMALTCTP